jgi:hypothetical protein
VGAHTLVISASDLAANTAAITITYTVGRTTPAITWSNPADISYGTALSGTQLDATASVSGTFTYTPPEGTVLGVGDGQTLSVLFTPDDTIAYTTATASVTINVLPPSITITPPSAIKFGKFSLTNVASSATAGTVTVTGDFVQWSVVAKAVVSGGNPAGYMMNGGMALKDPLYISDTNGGWTLASDGITYTGASTPGSLPLWASQNIEHGDKVSGDYTITVTFTGHVEY